MSYVFYFKKFNSVDTKFLVSCKIDIAFLMWIQGGSRKTYFLSVTIFFV